MPDPATTPFAHARHCRELRCRYGDAWAITEHAELPVWTAEHRSGDGRRIRILVAHSPADLAAKIDLAGNIGP